ncbi:MAG: HAD family hydrolase [Pseudomonadota bacterium]|nr:HAD family hydrolase [Pseudomonadota bacterium]
MTGAILFDVDGTLVDTNDLHAAAWQEAFRHFGVELGFQEIRDQIGKGGDNLIPTLLPEDVVRRRKQEIEDFRSELFQRDYLPRAVPFPGVRPLFERLYADGIKIVLASSAKEAELNFHQNIIGCQDLIFAATSKDDVERSKPCPDIFAAALAKVAPLGSDEVIVVGDSPWDVKAAANAGLKAVAVRCGGFHEQWLKEAGAAAIHDGPEDLLARYPGWLSPA